MYWFTLDLQQLFFLNVTTAFAGDWKHDPFVNIKYMWEPSKIGHNFRLILSSTTKKSPVNNPGPGRHLSLQGEDHTKKRSLKSLTRNEDSVRSPKLIFTFTGLNQKPQVYEVNICVMYCTGCNYQQAMIQTTLSMKCIFFGRMLTGIKPLWKKKRLILKQMSLLKKKKAATRLLIPSNQEPVSRLLTS